MKTADLYERLKTGNPLCNEELTILETKLQSLYDILHDLHCPDYYLVTKDVFHELDAVRQFIVARKVKYNGNA